MDLVHRLVSPTATICVLGAGNCNDLDLRDLILHGATLQLLDLDIAAVDEACVRAGIRDSERVSLVEIDLLSVCHESIGSVPLPDPSRDLTSDFDAVVSTCILSQLLDESLSEHDLAACDQVALAIDLRRAHLRLMAGLLRPGGVGILVSDLVSSDTCPDLKRVDASLRPGEIMDAAVSSGNFFHGLNPYAVLRELSEGTTNPVVVEDVRGHGPWLWDVTDRRTYLVFAASFVRR